MFRFLFRKVACLCQFGQVRQSRLVGLARPVIIAVYLSAVFFAGIPFSHAREDEKIYYFLNDYLGNVDVVLDEEANVVERRDYLPYGAERSHIKEIDESQENTYRFTGKELDEETGLYYYGARYYDPALARFISFDPLLLNEGSKPLASTLQNPQALNPYSYVTNNPVMMVDETGEYQKDVHYDLTINMALWAGFDNDQSRIIAFYDQWVDENPETAPNLANFSTKEGREAINFYHFTTREEAIDRISSAIKTYSLKVFGSALHTFQDSYSHEGLTPTTHILKWKWPDQTNRPENLAKATRMARASWFLLRKMNMAVNGTGDQTRDEYIKGSTKLWLEHKDEVVDYLKQEDKTDTILERRARVSEEEN